MKLKQLKIARREKGRVDREEDGKTSKSRRWQRRDDSDRENRRIDGLDLDRWTVIDKRDAEQGRRLPKIAMR